MSQEESIREFLLDSQFRLDSESLKQYESAVRQFLAYVGKSLPAITKSDIRAWLGHLKEKGYKPNTLASKLTGLKSFFKYCLEEDITLHNPAEKIPYPHKGEKLPYYLTLEQLNMFRRLLEGRLMERAILEVLYSTGVRISEMCAMKKENIDWSERTILIPNGKWKKGRNVHFTLECGEHLKSYLDSRTDDLPYVFLSLRFKDRPLHKNTVGKHYWYYAKTLEFKVTPHTLRHTFAAHLTQKGMPLNCIQNLLGHTDPHQTRYYARLYNQARKEKYDEFM